MGYLRKNICGESADVHVTACKNFSVKIAEVLKEFAPKNIFNAIETGLFFKCFSNKTLTFKEDKCFNGKQRFTILLRANMTEKEIKDGSHWEK